MLSSDQTTIRPRTKPQSDNDSDATAISRKSSPFLPSVVVDEQQFNPNAIAKYTDATIRSALEGLDEDETHINLSNKKSYNYKGLLDRTIEFLPQPSKTLTAAYPLLFLCCQLKSLTYHHAIKQLRKEIISEMNCYHQQLAIHLSDKQTIARLSYILCSFIDETILNTRWGQNSEWSQNSLLSFFHKDTDGGRKVFKILNIALKDSNKNIDILELSLFCLALGYRGQLRLDPKGDIVAEQQIKQIKSMLSLSSETNNSVNLKIGKTLNRPEKKLYNQLLPIWITLLCIVLSLFILYYHWLIELNKQSDHSIQLISKLIPTPKPQPLVATNEASKIFSLTELLAEEIRLGIVDLKGYHNYSMLILNGNELFKSGSSQLNVQHHPLIEKIAKSLESFNNKIIIAGHTDNKPIRSTQFPSNWHLSLARANQVVKLMVSSAILKGRIIPEGRGSTQPIADNNNPIGRAKNRRVEIYIYH